MADERDPSRTPRWLRRRSVLDEDDLKRRGLWSMKTIDPNSIRRLDAVYEESIVVNSVRSNSAEVYFVPAIKWNYGSTAFPASTQYTYVNFGNITTSTAQVTALYEHIKGYVYRDTTASAYEAWNAYLSGSNSSFVVSQSSTARPPFGQCLSTGTGALTAIRVMFMNRSFYGDRIKEGTFRMEVQPMFVDLSGKQALNFINDNATQTSSGQFASITGMVGLTGSLSAGVSGSFLTGFTIAMRVRFSNGGPGYQTILDRRSGDVSSSALNGFEYDVPGLSAINNSYVKNWYAQTYPLSACTSINAGYWGSSLYFNNYLNDGSAITVYPNLLPTQQLTGGTSATIKITNKGGGILRWAASAQYNWLTLVNKADLTVSNSSFSADLGNWVQSDGTALTSPGTTEAITWDNTTNGEMSGGKMKVGPNAPGATNDRAWKDFDVPAGVSGVVITFNETSTGDVGSTTPLQVTVKRGGTTPNGAASLSSFTNTHGQSSTPPNPGTITTYRYHVNLLANAPQYEFTGQKMWVGFSKETGSGKIYYIDDVQFAYVPSTIFSLSNTSSSTATITAYANGNLSTTSQGYSDVRDSVIWQQNIVIYSREANLEHCPNLPLNLLYKIEYDEGR